MDNGIYPTRYSKKPANFSDIQARLRVARASLSPSRFTDTDFDTFQQENERAMSETSAMNRVVPIIAGNEDKRQRPQDDIPFNNLEAFNKDLFEPKPDVYYRAQPSIIHQRVRADLGKYIIPSKANPTRPAVPNFFLEGKSSQGRADVAKRQALYNGAVGARAMHSLQNYGANEPTYDNKAYSFTNIYHAGTGTLQRYATHLTKPSTPGGQPKYHMTQLNAYVMTGSRETFVQGTTAYRNLRDLAMMERDSSIDHANQLAQQMPPPSSTTAFTDSHTSRSTPLAGGSDTSEDELARDEVTVKRLKPVSATSSTSVSYDPTLRRHSRTTEGAMETSKTAMTTTADTSRRSTMARDTSGSPAGRLQSEAPTSVGRRLESTERSRRSRELGQRQLPPSAVELTSEPTTREGIDCQRIQNQGRTLFVPNSRWVPCEKNGRPVLYFAQLGVYTYQIVRH